jgi:beta-lactamase regulating signal transducer with metallopeptidase domain
MTIASFVAMLNGSGLGDVFVAWLVWSLKGTVLLFVAWLVTSLLRGGSAAVRHSVWASGLAGMLLLPAFGRVVPAIHVGWLADVMRAYPAAQTQAPDRHPAASGAPAEHAERARPEGAPATVGTALQPRQLPAVPVETPVRAIRDLEFNITKTPSVGIPLVAAAVWLVVMTLLLFRAIAGVLQLSFWARRASGVDDAEWLSLTQRLAREMQIGRPVTLLQSNRACVPMTWGVVYPRILLPSDADSWLSGRRTVVLLHELAHIKRLDTLTQLLAQVSTALFWFHPAVWFAAREMRREREHACDDSVLDAGARASDYAHSLLQIARPLVAGAPAAAALAMARKSELEGRLLAILDPRIDRRPASRVRLAGASIAIVALAIPLAAVSPTHAAPHSAAIPATPSLPATTAIGAIDTAVKTPTIVARQPAPGTNSRRAPLPADTGSAKASTPASAAVRAVEIPPPSAARERLDWTKVNVAPPVAKRTPDVETLIAVTRAATKLTSDHDKAEVLLSVAKHYIPNNELRTAYFDAVLSMHNDFDRTRTLEPVLMKDSLPASAAPQLVRIAAAMSSDVGRGAIVMRVANNHPALTPSVRAALISVAGVFHSDFERARCIAAIARRGGLSADDAIRLIAVAKSISSSNDKANALLAIAGSRSLDTAEVRRAYIAAAETITSAFDYRRVIIRVIE